MSNDSKKWKDAKTQTPKVNKNGDSDYLLCLSSSIGIPFVAWYNIHKDMWIVAHQLAPSVPVDVWQWRQLPKHPDIVGV